MNVTAAGADAVTALLDRLIDDAALFPPASLTMAAALRAHARNRESAYASRQGRFVVPASRLEELRSVRDRQIPLTLSVIADGSPAGDAGLIAAARGDGLTVDSIECRAEEAGDLAAAAAFATGEHEVSVWFEAPFDAGWRGTPAVTMAALAAQAAIAPGVQWGAKVRCGGPRASLVPSVDDLAAFIVAAQQHAVPWKATAGLHHPIRRVAADGSAMHGFLNLAVAAVAHHAGAADARQVAAILADEDARSFGLDPRRLAWRTIGLDPVAIAAARSAAFRSFGSCSFNEPVVDLMRLGVPA